MIESTLSARDPVCGMAVEPTTAAARRTFEGRDVFFCAPGCAAAFDREPARYTHAAAGLLPTLGSPAPPPASRLPPPDAPGLSLSLEGMHCASCVTTIENALAAVPGVEGASVNLATSRADVRGANLDADRLVAAVRASGYDARPALDDEPRRTGGARPRRNARRPAADSRGGRPHDSGGGHLDGGRHVSGPRLGPARPHAARLPVGRRAVSFGRRPNPAPPHGQHGHARRDRHDGGVRPLRWPRRCFRRPLRASPPGRWGTSTTRRWA